MKKNVLLTILSLLCFSFTFGDILNDIPESNGASIPCENHNIANIVPAIDHLSRDNTPVPEYEFIELPTYIMTSYYDYMPGSYEGFPLQMQTDWGDGYYLTFFGQPSTISNGKVHLFYYDDNDFGSTLYGNGLNNGGELMYAALDIEFHAEWIPDGSSLLAAFFATPTSGEAPLTVNFTDLSTGNPTSWQWDFDNDGTIDSDIQNPTWIYDDPGLYTVSLTVYDGSTSDTETKTDYIDVRVNIPDANFKAAINGYLGQPANYNPTVADLNGITGTFNAYGSNISSIEGAQYLTNLTQLELRDNQISDISAVSGLTNLTYLHFGINQISDISVVSGLTNLTWLNLHNNQISDIFVVSGLTNLTYLYLHNNQISDISAVSGLTNLRYLFLNWNQIGDISAVSGLTNLTKLYLNNNQISDISAVSGLTNLTKLYLNNNQISDIFTVSGLTNLNDLHFDNNQISDISALVENQGLGSGDNLNLNPNPLSQEALNIHIPILQSRGFSYLQYLSAPNNYAACYPNPARNETGVSTNADLEWRGNFPSRDAVYDVWLGETNDNLINVGNGTAINDTLYSFTPTLNPNKDYWWKVRAVTATDTIWSGLWHFTTGEGPLLVTDFSADQTTVVAGTEIQFNDLSTGNPTSWQWDFNYDGTIDSYEQNPTWTYTTVGTYTVSLTASNGVDTDTETKTDYISVFSFPDFSVTPISFNETLSPGSSTTQIMTIENNEDSDLVWQIDIQYNQYSKGMNSGHLKAYNPNVTPDVQLAKGERDTRVGSPVTKGAGGPDNYGYTWIDSDETCGPEYIWNDIVSTGTFICGWIASGSYPALDEGYVGPFNLNFPFSFYDQSFSEIYIMTNGLICFDLFTGYTWGNEQLPNIYLPNNIICPFWDDFDGSSGGAVYYKSENDRFIVQYTNWCYYNSSDPQNFQIHLLSNGTITFYYENLSGNTSSASVGIENSDASDGLQIAYNTNYLHSQLAINIPFSPKWIITDLNSGIIAPNSTQDIEITLDATNLSIDNYSANINAICNIPDEPEVTVTVPVTLVVEQLNADFTADSTNVIVGTPVQFTDISNVNPTSWEWDFNYDGIIDSYEQNPEWIYDEVGIYTVSLTVSEGTNEDTEIKEDYITVNAVIPITAEFVADSTLGYAPLTVNFTDQSTQGTGAIIDWKWYFGDGDSSSIQNPTHIYQDPGIYSVSLTVTDVNNSTDTETKEGYIRATTSTQIPEGNVNGIWTVIYSPYEIQGDITIQDGDTLNIEPGVVVKFMDDYSFTIYGTLHAVGTETDSILFTTGLTSQNPGNWDRIEFYGNPSSNSIISYTKVEYAEYGIYCKNYSSPTISNNRIMDNKKSGIHCNDYSSPTISNNTINDNDFGIKCDHNSSPTISNNTIFNNDKDGIKCDHDSSPMIRNSTISYNNNYGIKCDHNSSPTIFNNIIYDNGTGIKATSLPSAMEYNLFWLNDPAGEGSGIPSAFGEIVTINVNGDSCDTYFNLFINPLFVDPANYDFHLTFNSPCIDAGNPSSAPDPDDTIVDLGAYYYHQEYHFNPVYEGNGYNNMTFFITCTTIDGVNMVANDEIGIFDGDLCVGAGKLISEIPPIFQMTASADNPITTTIIDGFIDGHMISYKLWDGDEQLEHTDVLSLYTVGVGMFSQLGTVQLSLQTNMPPVADAGPDQMFDESTLVTLNGSGSYDPNGDTITYLWAAPEGITLSDSTIVNPTFITPSVITNTNYTFTLVVNDGTFNSEPDSVIITVRNIDVVQAINLIIGWNMISFYVLPDNLDMLAIMQPLINDGVLVKVQDEVGQAIAYLPDYGWYNGIGDMSPTEGYLINVNSIALLSTLGSLVPSPIDVPLLADWNIMGYPISIPQNALSVVQSLIDYSTLVKVQDEVGHAIVYLPDYGWFNGIEDFLPGEGYYINVNADDTLTINESIILAGTTEKPEVISQGEGTIRSECQHFIPVYQGNGYNNMTFLINSATIDGVNIEVGDEIGIFDGEICVGGGILTNEINPVFQIASSADNPLTPSVIDGFIDGHQISYKLWDVSESVEIRNVEPIYMIGDGTFLQLGTAFLNLEGSSLIIEDMTPTKLHGNYPNPFKKLTTISFSIKEESFVTVEVYNLLGQRVKNLINKKLEAEFYTIVWDGKDGNNISVMNGIYFYKMSAGNYSEIKKMVLMR